MLETATNVRELSFGDAIKGTQITLKAVLGHLALGDTLENIVKTYPGMAPEGVRAVIAFAASFADLELAGTLSSQYPQSLDELSKKETQILASTLGTGFMNIAVAEIYVREGLFQEAANPLLALVGADGHQDKRFAFKALDQFRQLVPGLLVRQLRRLASLGIASSGAGLRGGLLASPDPGLSRRGLSRALVAAACRHGATLAASPRACR
jgi:uncharacterized protein (DUF433 family)